MGGYLSMTCPGVYVAPRAEPHNQTSSFLSSPKQVSSRNMSSVSFQSGAPSARALAAAAEPSWSTVESAHAIKLLKNAVVGVPLYVFPGNEIVVRASSSEYYSLTNGKVYPSINPAAYAVTNVLKHLNIPVIASPSKLKAAEAAAYMKSTGFPKHRILSMARVSCVTQLTPEDFIIEAGSLPAFLQSLRFTINSDTMSSASTVSAGSRPAVPAAMPTRYDPARSHAASMGSLHSSDSSSPSLLSGVASAFKGALRPAVRVVASAFTPSAPEEEEFEDEDEDASGEEESEGEEVDLGIYYKTPTGKKYHIKYNCSRAVEAISPQDAISAKLGPCQLCCKDEAAASAGAPVPQRVAAPAAPAHAEHDSTVVYKSKSGAKYHTSSGCNRFADIATTLGEAHAARLTLCSNCSSRDGLSARRGAPSAAAAVVPPPSARAPVAGPDQLYGVIPAWADVLDITTPDDFLGTPRIRKAETILHREGCHMIGRAIDDERVVVDSANNWNAAAQTHGAAVRLHATCCK